MGSGKWSTNVYDEHTSFFIRQRKRSVRLQRRHAPHKEFKLARARHAESLEGESPREPRQRRAPQTQPPSP